MKLAAHYRNTKPSQVYDIYFDATSRGAMLERFLLSQAGNLPLGKTGRLQATTAGCLPDPQVESVGVFLSNEESL